MNRECESKETSNLCVSEIGDNHTSYVCQCGYGTECKDSSTCMNPKDNRKLAAAKSLSATCQTGAYWTQITNSNLF